jgi:lysophospholipase L1-like esterase
MARGCVVAAVLALAAPAAAAAKPDRYVALGDSYSSGVGTRDYSLGEDCQRSPYSYPALVARNRADTRLVFRACGGAKTADVLGGQKRALTRRTEIVTITIGGNDAGFGPVVRKCAEPWPSRCWDEIDRAERFIRTELPRRLGRVYRMIDRRAPRAKTIVVGYPRIFNEGDECNALGRISPEEQRRLNDVTDVLARVTRRRARRRGFDFTDARPAFEGHQVCDEEEWINGVSRPLSESYHPNRAGHRMYDRLVRATLLGPGF